MFLTLDPSIPGRLIPPALPIVAEEGLSLRSSQTGPCSTLKGRRERGLDAGGVVTQPHHLGGDQHVAGEPAVVAAADEQEALGGGGACKSQQHEVTQYSMDWGRCMKEDQRRLIILRNID